MRRAVRWIAVTVPAYTIAGGGLHFPGSLDDVGPELGPLVFGSVTGVLIGCAQLFALQGVLAHPWLWPLATAAGMAITHGTGDGLSRDVGYLPVAIVGGIAVGMFQAAVLRRPVWAFATFAALAIGIFGGYTLGHALGFNSVFEDDAFARHATMTALSAVLYALFTAPIVARMAGDRRPEGPIRA